VPSRIDPPLIEQPAEGGARLGLHHRVLAL